MLMIIFVGSKRGNKQKDEQEENVGRRGGKGLF